MMMNENYIKRDRNYSRAGMENISVMFAKPDKRASWEESFNEAKQKLGESLKISLSGSFEPAKNK
jgi:hypothetical protein